MADKPKDENPIEIENKKNENVRYTDKDPSKIMPKNYKSTADIAISKNLADQIIGQNKAVHIIKKAAGQRRNVLLIGEPGTGKSMLGLALAELLPKEKLVDIISFPNPNDENTPLIRTVPAGQGRDLVARAKIQGMNMFKNQNVVFFILVLVAILAPWWSWVFYIKHGAVVAAIMTGASLVVSILFVVGILLTSSLGRRMEGHIRGPRLIVDNFKKKQAPFNDATGAHAGALLGDVLHDPFQSFSSTSIRKCISRENVFFGKKLELVFDKFKDRIEKRNEKNNYEALHLPKNQLYVLGENNGSVSPVEVLSSNRYDYAGEMIKLTTSENKELIVTPEHKIAVWENNKIAYIEAKDVKENTEIVSTDEDNLIDFPVPIQTANWLKERGLLPLKVANKELKIPDWIKKYKLQMALDRDMKDKLITYLDLRAKGLGAESIMGRLQIDQKYLYKILNSANVDIRELEATTA